MYLLLMLPCHIRLVQEQQLSASFQGPLSIDCQVFLGNEQGTADSKTQIAESRNVHCK